MAGGVENLRGVQQSMDMPGPVQHIGVEQKTQGGEQHIGVQSSAAKIPGPETRVVLPISEVGDTAEKIEHETPSTRMTVAMGSERVTKDFTVVHWQDDTDARVAVVTTHPELIDGLAAGGPLGLEAAARGQEVDVLTLETAQGTRIDNPQVIYAHRIHVTAEGLLTTYKRELAEVVGEHNGFRPVTIDVPEDLENNPQNVHFNVGLQLEHSNLLASSPELQQAITRLGFEYTQPPDLELAFDFNFDYGKDPVTMLLPQALRRRLAELRATDTQSGIFYHDVALFPSGKLYTPSYLSARSNRQQPIGASGVGFYTHDVTTAHLFAPLVFGELYMDLGAQYAQSALETGNSRVQAEAVGNLDDFDGFLHRHPFAISKNYNPRSRLDAMHALLKARGKIEDLLVTKYLRTLEPVAEITPAALLYGLQRSALERLKSSKQPSM